MGDQTESKRAIETTVTKKKSNFANGRISNRITSWLNI